MASNAPIGVFDSGLGGISVVRELHQAMPHERVLYFGDSAHAPYGTKTPDQVRERCLAITKRFVRQGVKAVVIACNTATSVAAELLRSTYPIPIIGMEPALKVACDRGEGTRQRIIVAATPLTLRERKFAALMERFSSGHDIHPEPCPELVGIVEQGRLYDETLVMDTLHRHLDHHDPNTIDSVVLGCTHFIFYRRHFRHLLPPSSALIDGNEGTVRHLHAVLASLDALADPTQEGAVELRNSRSGERIRALSRELLTRP